MFLNMNLLCLLCKQWVFPVAGKLTTCFPLFSRVRSFDGYGRSTNGVPQNHVEGQALVSWEHSISDIPYSYICIHAKKIIPHSHTHTHTNDEY